MAPDEQKSSDSSSKTQKKRYHEARERNNGTDNQPEPNFHTFLAGLYTQTLSSLGAVEDPVNGGYQQDLDQARYLIDTLGMIKEKTAGNLESEEKNYFINLLQDVRMRYVAAVENTQATEEQTESADNEK